MNNNENNQNELIEAMVNIAKTKNAKDGSTNDKISYLENLNSIPYNLFAMFLNTNNISLLKYPLSFFSKLSFIISLAIVYILSIFICIIPYYYKDNELNYILNSIFIWISMFFIIIIIFPIKMTFQA